MKRIGLIGVGAWGRRYIETIRDRTDCCITAVARASARSDSPIPGATTCESWQALVLRAAEGELDGVIVATTPAHQAEVAMACASAGVPVLVEKPLGLSLSDVERVRGRFDSSPRKAPVLVNYIHLWSAAYVELKRHVEAAGGYRRIEAIETEGFNRGPFRSWSSLFDYGPHDFAMSLGLLGTNATFTLQDCRRVEPATGGELFDIRFELGNVPVHTRVGNGGDAKARRFAVRLSGGPGLVYDDTQPHPLKLRVDAMPVPVDSCTPLAAVIAAFLELIERGAAGKLAPEAAGASLALSAGVNGILDEVASSLERAAARRVP